MANTAAAIAVIALLIGSGALIFASRPPVVSQPEISTVCPVGQQAVSEDAFGNFSCATAPIGQAALVQQNSGVSSTNSKILTYPDKPDTADMLLLGVFIHGQSGTPTPTTVTDNNGLTWTFLHKAGGCGVNAHCIYMYWTPFTIAPATETVTVTLNTTGTWDLKLYEFTGIDYSNLAAEMVVQTATGSTLAMSVPSFTPNSNWFVLADAIWMENGNSARTWTVSAPFINFGNTTFSFTHGGVVGGDSHYYNSIYYPSWSSSFGATTATMTPSGGTLDGTWAEMVMVMPPLANGEVVSTCPAGQFAVNESAVGAFGCQSVATSPCSQIISVVSTTYTAKDCKTGTTTSTGTNATTVIRAAIAATSAGHLYFKNGTYMLSGTKTDRLSIKYILAMKTGVQLIGESKTATILKAVNSTAATMIVADSLGVGEADDFLVSTMTIDGNRAGQTAGGVDGNQACMYLNENQRISLSQLIVKNCVYQGVYDSLNGQTSASNLFITTTGFEGYSISGTSYGSYSGLRITNTGIQAGAGRWQSGLYISGPASKNFIAGVTSYSNSEAGVGMTSDASTHDNHQNTLIEISTFSNGNQGQIYGDGANANTWVTGNNFYGLTSELDGGTSDGGIEFLQVNASTISGVHVLNAKGPAFRFASATNNNVFGLYADDNQGIHTTTYFLRETGSSANNTINGGHIPASGFLNAQYSMVSTSGSTINNVAGINPHATDDVTAGTSIWTYTDQDPYEEQMILKTVNGISAETCQGVTSFPITVGSVCLLRPGDTMVVTWTTTAPVFHRVPLDRG